MDYGALVGNMVSEIMVPGIELSTWMEVRIIPMHIKRAILFANHKANGVVTNIGLLANTVDDTGSYMAG